MLEAVNLNYSISGKILIKDVSGSFAPGKLHLILGPNGAGKSTLIKLLSGQLVPQVGEVKYDGAVIENLVPKELAKQRAILSQTQDLSFPLKVWEVVMMGRYAHFATVPQPKDEAAAEAAMRFFQVLELAERNYLTLSGGEKQRVHFARVMAQIWYPEPGKMRCIFLDEPLTFLDIYYQHLFMEHLMELVNDHQLLAIGVIHDINLAAKFANEILFLKDGTIIDRGDVQSIITTTNIKRVFNVDASVHVADRRSVVVF